VVAAASLHRDEDGSMKVPVLATFTGVAGLPSLLAVASNSLNPSLVIRPGALTYRVTMARSVSIHNVATVRVQTTLGSTTLVFTFVGGAFTLSAKVASPTVAETVLTAYPELAAKRVYRPHKENQVSPIDIDLRKPAAGISASSKSRLEDAAAFDAGG
jgi:hypothetical protein